MRKHRHPKHCEFKNSIRYNFEQITNVFVVPYPPSKKLPGQVFAEIDNETSIRAYWRRRLAEHVFQLKTLRAQRLRRHLERRWRPLTHEKRNTKVVAKRLDNYGDTARQYWYRWRVTQSIWKAKLRDNRTFLFWKIRNKSKEIQHFKNIEKFKRRWKGIRGNSFKMKEFDKRERITKNKTRKRANKTFS